MTLAEEIAEAVMRPLGYRYPDKHPKWDQSVRIAQRVIDRHLELMKRTVETEVRLDVSHRRRQRREFVTFMTRITFLGCVGGALYGLIRVFFG